MIESGPEASAAHECVLRLHAVARAFSGIQALAGVSFDLQRGEVHALVGENGAGKSTLIKIIAGAYVPDSGTIEVDGQQHAALEPDQARQLGIGVVYQEFNLLPELSVAENIFLGAQPTGRFGLLDSAERRRRTLALLDRLGAHVDPDRLVKYLTVGEQQIVEIAKALAVNARILIMDEPSAVLPSHDMDRLYAVIRALRASGASIVYISHRLEEIFLIADRVTVLKDGRSVMTRPVREVTRAEVVNSMVGRELNEQYPPPDRAAGRNAAGGAQPVRGWLCVRRLAGGPRRRDPRPGGSGRQRADHSGARARRTGQDRLRRSAHSRQERAQESSSGVAQWRSADSGRSQSARADSESQPALQHQPAEPIASGARRIGPAAGRRDSAGAALDAATPDSATWRRRCWSKT